MDLKIKNQAVTLVDQVEKKLFEYIAQNNMKVGDSVPNENELSEALGVSRSVLREALSRLRMLGVVESRTRRGMVLSEPHMFGGLQRVTDPMILGEQSLINLLGFRVALELGICSSIIDNVNDKYIADLEKIVEEGGSYELNFYKAESENAFHSKLYEITENESIMQFQEIIYPVSLFIRDKFKDFFEPINRELLQKDALITHQDLLSYIKNKDKEGLRKGMEQHFAPYSKFLKASKNGENLKKNKATG
ncbi:FadR/GntR family transcriptional regulator [Rhodohalobacter sp. 614A]|uniref:FadR/GntR family transcriptional regulator n=1 Tax=Rhodohalobacter sp. 614A TaxID=2908649 RepID=UPI001F2E6DAD|nr:GntR family transcriptional regulator [Rhodohalobacter sp. 614A]